MDFNEWFTIINTAIGIIGIIVGIIGGKSLYTATKIKNSVKSAQNSTIQQAQTITINNNGLDTYAIVKLSRDTTQEELGEIVARINQAETKLTTVESKMDGLPKVYVSKTPPTGPLHTGDIWCQID